MITVKEALCSCDDVILLREVEKTYRSKNKKKFLINGTQLLLSPGTLATYEYVLKLRGMMECKHSEKRNFLINCFHDYLEDDGTVDANFSSSMIKEDDVNGNVRLEHKKYTISELKDKSLDELKSIYSSMAEIEISDFYAYELCEASEILGYWLSDELIKKYGLEANLATVLYEMTFFGFDEDNNQSEKQKVIDDIEEARKQIEELEETTSQTPKADVSESEKDLTEDELAEKAFYINSIIHLFEKIENYNIVCEEIAEGF